MILATEASATGINSTQLKKWKEKILTLWAERCLKEVVSAGTVTNLSLRNSLPLYLDHLIDALATNRKLDFKSVVAHDEEGTRIGKLHGGDRAGEKNYALTEVIFEYHILREVIFQVLEFEGQLSIAQRDIILDSVEQAVNDAAVEFSELHMGIQKKFVNTLTHDLKTPITAARLNAQLISRHQDLPETAKKSAKKVIRSMDRLEAMIHDLLDAGRLRSGEKLALQFDVCDLDLMVRDVVEEMSDIHGDRFILNSMPTLKGYFSCDGLRRALENLIGNAVKYGALEEPITITLRANVTHVELEVHNEGQPIPESEISLLFQQYRRSKTAQEGVKTGWGLGLTLVKGVVDAHGGKICIDSRPEFGTSFTLKIPMMELALMAKKN